VYIKEYISILLKGTVKSSSASYIMFFFRMETANDMMILIVLADEDFTKIVAL
jgi:hypothetical protein